MSDSPPSMRLHFEQDLPHQREALAAVLAQIEDRPEREPQKLLVEMETGTGKTYVYLRLVHELHALHGWSKFVVVVPTVAIREGVASTIALTRAHFRALYGEAIRPTVFASRRIEELRDFAHGTELQVLIINIDAFNKARNLIRREHDLFFGDKPIHLLQKARPVVLVDEPQRFSTQRSREALAELGARCTIEWTATPRDRSGLVYQLSPTQALERGLVKRIEVSPVEGDPRRRVEAAVRLQLENERLLRTPGRPTIKPLTLFFLDRVSDYEDAGKVRHWIEECWEAERRRPCWSELDLPPATEVHAGYFARGGSGRARDTRGGSIADARAYELIMRDKPRLLTPEEPLRFIVSHSALREGWDNPNVFVLCSLNRAQGTIRRRQEIGRGLRLPVDATGRRVSRRECCTLTVVAGEAYSQFAEGLQREFGEAGLELDAFFVHDWRERIPLRPAHSWEEHPAATCLWPRLSRGVTWTADFSLPDFAERAAEVLGSIELTTPRSPAESLPDLLGSLQQATGMGRSTLSAALRAAGQLDELVSFVDFVPAASEVLRRVRDELIAGSLRYSLTGVPAPPPTALHEGGSTGYSSQSVTSTKSVRREVAAHAPWELPFLRRLETDDRVLSYLRVPPDFGFDGPHGFWRPEWVLGLAEGRVVACDSREATTHGDRLRQTAGRAALRALEVDLRCTRDFDALVE